MTCLCGDPECPSCGSAQGTLAADLADALVDKLSEQVADLRLLLARIRRAAENNALTPYQRWEAIVLYLAEEEE